MARVVALVIAAVLIVGGTTGLSVAHGQAATTITSAVAVLAGLLFLKRAARK